MKLLKSFVMMKSVNVREIVLGMVSKIESRGIRARCWHLPGSESSTTVEYGAHVDCGGYNGITVLRREVGP